MSRQMLLAIALVTMLMAVSVMPAAAQSDEYEIWDLSLLSYGEERAFHRVVTGERSLSMDQADEVCKFFGLDYAIGIDKRFRFEGTRTTAVTCVGDEPLGHLDVWANIEGDPAPIEIFISPADPLNDDPGVEGSCGLPYSQWYGTTRGQLAILTDSDRTYCVVIESENPATNETHIVFIVDLPAGDPLGDVDVMATFTYDD